MCAQDGPKARVEGFLPPPPCCMQYVCISTVFDLQIHCNYADFAYSACGVTTTRIFV